jgi:plasmid stability protein
MTVIELPDEQAAALRAKAAAAGLTLEAWLIGLASAQVETPDPHPLRTAADIVLDCMRDVPPEIMATLPKDGASQHDHYIYGWPKRET